MSNKREIAVESPCVCTGWSSVRGRAGSRSIRFGRQGQCRPSLGRKGEVERVGEGSVTIAEYACLFSLLYIQWFLEFFVWLLNSMMRHARLDRGGNQTIFLRATIQRMLACELLQEKHPWHTSLDRASTKQRIPRDRENERNEIWMSVTSLVIVGSCLFVCKMIS